MQLRLVAKPEGPRKVKDEAVKLWNRLLGKLQDQVLFVISTRSVEPESAAALRKIETAINRTYTLLRDLLIGDSRMIFFERQHVIAKEIFNLLRNYDVRKHEGLLISLSYELRNLARQRERLKA